MTDRDINTRSLALPETYSNSRLGDQGQKMRERQINDTIRELARQVNRTSGTPDIRAIRLLQPVLKYAGIHNTNKLIQLQLRPTFRVEMEMVQPVIWHYLVELRRHVAA